MVIANASDGRTLTFDLTDPDACDELRGLLRSGAVTGLSIHHDGVTTSLPQPKRFPRRPLFGFELLDKDGEPVAEQVHCQAGDVRVSLTRTLRSKHTRCDLVRTGRMRYNPSANGKRR